MISDFAEPFVILCFLLFSFWTCYIGYKLAKVEDNNYEELFKAYMGRIDDLVEEVHYWHDCYTYLKNSIDDDKIEDKVMNGKGEVIGIILKK